MQVLRLSFMGLSRILSAWKLMKNWPCGTVLSLLRLVCCHIARPIDWYTTGPAFEIDWDQKLPVGLASATAGSLVDMFLNCYDARVKLVLTTTFPILSRLYGLGHVSCATVTGWGSTWRTGIPRICYRRPESTGRSVCCGRLSRHFYAAANTARVPPAR